jgi:hypothetical protein
MDDMSDPHAPAIQKRSTPVPTSQALPKNAVSSHANQLTPRSTHSDLRGSYHEAAPGSAGKNKPAMFTKALGRTISRTVVTSLVVIVSILLPNFERVMGFLGVESFFSSSSFMFPQCHKKKNAIFSLTNFYLSLYAHRYKY